VSSPRTQAVRSPSIAAYLGLLLGIALGAAGMYLWTYFAGGSPSRRPTDVAVTKTKLSALGRLQPSGGVISVFGLPGDRIEKLSVKEGDKVAKDAILAELASRKDRELARDLVADQLREARAQRTAISDAGKAKIAVIDAEIALLQSGQDDDLKAQDAKITAGIQQSRVTLDAWNRLKSLDPSVVSPTDVEKSELLYRQSESELTAARLMRDKTEKGYTHNLALLQAKRSATLAELEEVLKRVMVDSIAENLKIAERGLSATQIKAPMAGRVLRLIGHEGDATGNQPILQLADTDAMVVIAEVYETDIQQLDAWLSESPVLATVTSRALGKPLTGEVQRRQITHMVGKNQLFSIDPRQDVDRRVVEVHVDLHSDAVELASRYSGLEVQVEFQPSPKP
jgi:HlyD family secretion protein